jgi:hypothetical protein
MFLHLGEFSVPERGTQVPRLEIYIPRLGT